MTKIVCGSCGTKLKASERARHEALYNPHVFYDTSAMPEWTKKGKALAMTLTALCLLIKGKELQEVLLIE
jgi:hypothetical protein